MGGWGGQEGERGENSESGLSRKLGFLKKLFLLE